ncbi:hypothetical protein ASD81_14765 [Nocardioides sp. Root614]|nr:hypothetical protein ASD81_14765 [Nocardioides sp. Root614]KRA89422.1 hypothetical protein ASD84_15030 [Nocardioides sp. Root682]
MAALLLTVAPFAGCGDNDSPAPKSEPSRSSPSEAASSSSSPASFGTAVPSPTSTPDATARSLGPCLLTPASVSDAIAGSWTIIDRQAGGCSFASDRGARLGVQRVEKRPGEDLDDLYLGLASARVSCTAAPREIPKIGGFACVEAEDTGDLVIGNVIGGDDLWVVIIPGAPGGGDHAPELDAMVAILEQLPPR